MKSSRPVNLSVTSATPTANAAAMTPTASATGSPGNVNGAGTGAVARRRRVVKPTAIAARALSVMTTASARKLVSHFAVPRLVTGVVPRIYSVTGTACRFG